MIILILVYGLITEPEKREIIPFTITANSKVLNLSLPNRHNPGNKNLHHPIESSTLRSHKRPHHK